MKTLLKILVVAVGIYSTSAMALTAQQCKDLGGTWAQVIGNTGTCKLSVEAVKQASGTDIRNITAQKCKDIGGQVSGDGKSCLVITKNIVKNAAPPSDK